MNILYLPLKCYPSASAAVSWGR